YRLSVLLSIHFRYEKSMNKAETVFEFPLCDFAAPQFFRIFRQKGRLPREKMVQATQQDMTRTGAPG
ncbi:MAG: hypothetical protein LUE95_02770, partial [Oscillospiraceae bacterium]|nr:hypothetical protein [Oscillospiraceae bacterium]